MIFDECGCQNTSPCLMECGSTFVCGGDEDTFECEQCVGAQAEMQGQCVVDAALGEECQNDFQCSSYVQCVINGG